MLHPDPVCKPLLCVQDAAHGQLVQIQVEGDHYLYQPSVAGVNAVFCPEIGKYFWAGTHDTKPQWKMEHIVHDMSLDLGAKKVQLPFVCGDRVAFYHRVSIFPSAPHLACVC